MGELRQFHASLKISQIKELSKGDFLIIGDSVHDKIILQSESKMKASLDQNVFPKPCKQKKHKQKILLQKEFQLT